MNYTAVIPPSPVSAAFSGIQWDPLDRLKLTNAEKSILRSGEDNPVDYTLSNHEDACMFVRTLLKLLMESVGASGPSKKVSKIKETLPEPEALQMLYIDPTGVVTHYAVYKLYEVIVSLREKKENSTVNMMNTFYENGKLLEDWRPLLRMLHLGGSGDPYAQRCAALCLACILFVGCPSQISASNNSGVIRELMDEKSVKEALNALLSWISSQLQSSSGVHVTLVTPALITLVGCIEARLMFANSGGIGYIARHLRSKQHQQHRYNSKGPRNGSGGGGASAQQLYELCFCLWTMTYDCNTHYNVRIAFARDGAVKALCDLISSAPREKVTRVASSALRNLAECTDDNDYEHHNLYDTNKHSDDNKKYQQQKVVNGSLFLNDMIVCGLIKSVDLMKERQWSDGDIIDDIKTLNKLLHDNYKEMSRWDVYENEVLNGNLEWGVLHTEKFFKQNCKLLEGKDSDFFLLKRLVILVTSDDEDVASIACYDIGEFCRFYPNGKSIAKRIGAKDAIMKLIDHENIELQRRALQSVSKMLVQNWEAVK
mmetsp:Transcript_4676/g.5369  ORF Transcript_4676/g.5369 Transcript_4676/m.5369 type:complete len:541 (-) Transcript_4676:460-2082(-)